MLYPGTGLMPGGGAMLYPGTGLMPGGGIIIIIGFGPEFAWSTQYTIPPIRRRPTGMPIPSPIARPSPPPTPPLCHILGSAFSVRTVVAASLARPLTSVMDTNFTSLRRRERMYIRMLPMPCPDFGFDVLRPLPHKLDD